MADASVAVITGAGRGIGAATAKLLAAEGWSLGLIDICADEAAVPYPLATRKQLDDVASSCDGIGLVADVRDQAALEAAVASTVEQFGRLDAAISAAGVVVGGSPAWETDDLTWETMLDVNLSGAWRLARAAIPALLDEGGRFVAVASAASTHGLPQLAAYTAAKHGLLGLVRALAAELAPSGVTANAVAPASTYTEMLDASAAIYGLDDVAEFAQHQRLGRILQPDEVAAAVVWLCSPEASGVTGATLPVGGAFG